MDFEFIHDRRELENYLRKNIFLNIYAIGDLDDFFWPCTCWFGHRSAGKVDSVALLYTGMKLPTLIIMSEDISPARELLASIEHLLPDPVYCHLSPGLEGALEKSRDLETHRRFYRMALLDREAIYDNDCRDVVQLKGSDLEELLGFYDRSYPRNWFDPRMLETGKYFCIRHNGNIVSAGGIHVYSSEYRVGTLGNIATHPEYRGSGFGTAVTAMVCRSMLKTVDHIGLNVRTDNSAAISCYEKLGFRTVASYCEFMARRKERKQ
ncbi:MAG: GNAT family N-acetyltransferase [Candidatus Aegiribacteria sp.]|nr:GNAT family N-acetyltransferase [Candidatus Aegiribacteria sp.]